MFKPLLSAAILALAAASASAGGVSETRRSERVQFADLDLRSHAGQASLDRRIRNAAHRVCVRDSLWNSHADAGYLRCRKAAVSKARDHAQVIIARVQAAGQVASAR